MDFITYVTYAISFIVVGEGLNCMYPRLEDTYDSEGMVCKWEERDFYYDKTEGEYILFPVDSTDNCFEAKARKRYWSKR
jgi:hypothetical protein